MRVAIAALVFSFCFLPSIAQTPPEPVYQDSQAAMSARVADLLSRMTLEEKIAQLESGLNRPPYLSSPGSQLFEGNTLSQAAAKKMFGLGLGTFAFLDEFNGVPDGPEDVRTEAHRRNLLQHWVKDNTRLGIPLLFHGEALHGAVVKGATSFPQAVALGSTWDPELLTKVYSRIALEERALGNTLTLSPVLDLSRDPRFGRVEEMYSEDPFLVSTLGVAAIRALQGSSDLLDHEHVFATAKHFIHGQPENGTNSGPSDYSERTMRSIFLVPFEHAVKDAHIEVILPSYNETRGGIPSSANSWLLRDLLRGEWGFQGITASDYGAVDQLYTVHHVATDLADAGLLAFRSGLDMELPEAVAFPGLATDVRSGRLSESDVDKSVSRVLMAKFRAGLFDQPFVDEDRAVSEVGSPAASPLARRAADEAIILLKNDHDILPLGAARIRTIAVIGPNANKVRLGGYSAIPKTYVSVLEGIKRRAGNGMRVVYAEGCRISALDTAPNRNGIAPYEAPSEETDRKLMQEAIKVAKTADLVVLVLGGNEVVSREALGDIGMAKPVYGDSDSLELPGRQDELIERLSQLKKPTVAVLLNGKAYSLDLLSHRVSAILEGWYLGQETGNAIAGVLFGDVNPSGHLPVTIPRNVGQLPVYYYKTPAARRGYVFDDNSPLYSFGFGMTYTSFRFGVPTLNKASISTSDTATVSFTVRNTGKRAGGEVAQMYIHHTVSSTVQPVIMLRAFERVHLEPGEVKTVTFHVGPEELFVWNVAMQKVVEPGSVDIFIGDTSTTENKVRLQVQP